MPVTASEIFRNNYIANKTFKKMRGVKQWIPSTHDIWFKLKSNLLTGYSALYEKQFMECMVDAREVGDLFRAAMSQFPPFGDGFRAGIIVHLYLAQLNMKVFQFQ